MARGTTHAPKPEGQRRRRNAPAHAETVLTDDGEVRGPELTGAHHPETVEWYETWRRAPQAAAFLSTDWQRLRILAPIMDRYFTKPSAAALSEIRMNEERLGATFVDRQRARMRVEEDESEAAPVVSLVSRRESIAERLSGSAD